MVLILNLINHIRKINGLTLVYSFGSWTTIYNNINNILYDSTKEWKYILTLVDFAIKHSLMQTNIYSSVIKGKYYNMDAWKGGQKLLTNKGIYFNLLNWYQQVKDGYLEQSRNVQ